MCPKLSFVVSFARPSEANLLQSNPIVTGYGTFPGGIGRLPTEPELSEVLASDIEG